MSGLIRTCRNRLNMSQQELGELVGFDQKVAQVRISEIESNRRKYVDPDLRRRLAAALGVRHIDLLVAAGELRPDELPQEGAVREPFGSNDPRRPVLEALQDVAPDSEKKRWVLEQAVYMFRNAQAEGDE